MQQAEDYEFDPNFAILCSFFDKFGSICSTFFDVFTVSEFKSFLEARHVSKDNIYAKVINKFLNKIGTYAKDWEQGLKRFCKDFPERDDLLLNNTSFCALPVPIKLRILKNLCEDQFEFNDRFNAQANDLLETSREIRHEPLGKDRHGRSYWLVDGQEGNIRMFRGWRNEVTLDETWNVICRDLNDFKELIDVLKESDEENEERPDPPLNVPHPAGIEHAEREFMLQFRFPYHKPPKHRSKEEILESERNHKLKHCHVRLKRLQMSDYMKHTKFNEKVCKDVKSQEKMEDVLKNGQSLKKTVINDHELEGTILKKDEKMPVSTARVVSAPCGEHLEEKDISTVTLNSIEAMTKEHSSSPAIDVNLPESVGNSENLGTDSPVSNDEKTVNFSEESCSKLDLALIDKVVVDNKVDKVDDNMTCSETSKLSDIDNMLNKNESLTTGSLTDKGSISQQSGVSIHQKIGNKESCTDEKSSFSGVNTNIESRLEKSAIEVNKHTFGKEPMSQMLSVSINGQEQNVTDKTHMSNRKCYSPIFSIPENNICDQTISAVSIIPKSDSESVLIDVGQADMGSRNTDLPSETENFQSDLKPLDADTQAINNALEDLIKLEQIINQKGPPPASESSESAHRPNSVDDLKTEHGECVGEDLDIKKKSAMYLADTQNESLIIKDKSKESLIVTDKSKEEPIHSHADISKSSDFDIGILGKNNAVSKEILEGNGDNENSCNISRSAAELDTTRVCNAGDQVCEKEPIQSRYDDIEEKELMSRYNEISGTESKSRVDEILEEKPKSRDDEVCDEESKSKNDFSNKLPVQSEFDKGQQIKISNESKDLAKAAYDKAKFIETMSMNSDYLGDVSSGPKSFPVIVSQPPTVPIQQQNHVIIPRFGVPIQNGAQGIVPQVLAIPVSSAPIQQIGLSNMPVLTIPVSGLTYPNAVLKSQLMAPPLLQQPILKQQPLLLPLGKPPPRILKKSRKSKCKLTTNESVVDLTVKNKPATIVDLTKPTSHIPTTVVDLTKPTSHIPTTVVDLTKKSALLTPATVVDLTKEPAKPTAGTKNKSINYGKGKLASKKSVMKPLKRVTVVVGIDGVHYDKETGKPFDYSENGKVIYKGKDGFYYDKHTGKPVDMKLLGAHSNAGTLYCVPMPSSAMGNANQTKYKSILQNQMSGAIAQNDVEQPKSKKPGRRGRKKQENYEDNSEDNNSSDNFEKMLEDEQSEKSEESDPDYDYDKISRRVRAAKEKKLPKIGERKPLPKGLSAVLPLDSDSDNEPMTLTDIFPIVRGQNAKRAAALKKRCSSDDGIDLIELDESESDEEVVDVTPCTVCNLDDDPASILLCDDCDASYHLRCLSPPLVLVPLGDWYCPQCEHEKLLGELTRMYKRLYRHRPRGKYNKYTYSRDADEAGEDRGDNTSARDQIKISKQWVAIDASNIVEGRSSRNRSNTSYNMDSYFNNALKDAFSRKGKRKVDSNSSSSESENSAGENRENSKSKVTTSKKNKETKTKPSKQLKHVHRKRKNRKCKAPQKKQRKKLLESGSNDSDTDYECSNAESSSEDSHSGDNEDYGQRLQPEDANQIYYTSSGRKTNCTSRLKKMF